MASKEQLPRLSSTAAPAAAAGALRGEQPSGGSATTRGSGAPGVAAASAAKLGPKLASSAV